MKRPNKKIIAVELDQILVRTMDIFLMWHNNTYDTDMAMTDVYHNNTRDLTRVFGGTKEDGCAKLREFYESPEFNDLVPLRDSDDDDDETSGDDVSHGSNFIGTGQQQKQKQRWGALEVLQSLKKRKWTLVIVTYRPQFTHAVTQQFINRYYPGLFDRIYYCNQGLSVADQLMYAPKPISVMLQEIGADYLIDDSLEHCLDCSVLDMTLLLYDHHGKYTYNHMLPQKRPRHGRPTLTSTSKQLYQRSASRSSTLPDNVIRVKSWKDIMDQFPMPTSPLRYCHYPTTAPTNHIASTTSASHHRNSSFVRTTAVPRVTLWNDRKTPFSQVVLSDGTDDTTDDTDNDSEQNDNRTDDQDTSDDDDYNNQSTWNDRDPIAV